MKKFFMIAVMAVAALTANAQKGEYYVTPRANVGYMAMSNGDFKGGILAGIGCNFEYMIADKFGISAAVDFNYLEGDKSKFTYYSTKYGSYSYESQYTMGILAIPVLGNFHFGNFAVSAGVQPSFLISPKAKREITDGSITTTENEEITDGYNKFQFGIPVGLSYTFNVPVTVGLNVTIPVTNFLKNDAANETYISNLEVKKVGNTKLIPVLVTVGYRF